jgi:hypothetical protein
MRKILNTLIKFEIIIPTKKIAKSIFYRINKTNPLINTIRVLINQANEIEIEAEFTNSEKIFELNHEISISEKEKP